MIHILHADDAIFPKRLCNQCVIHQGNSLLVDFAITLLRDEFIYRLQIWVPPFNVLEKDMAIHSSILAWRIPWTE